MRGQREWGIGVILIHIRYSPYPKPETRSDRSPNPEWPGHPTTPRVSSQGPPPPSKALNQALMYSFRALGPAAMSLDAQGF